jgi:hypothetical protein
VRRWTVTGQSIRWGHGPFRCEGSQLAEDESVEVVPLSEVREVLLADAAIKAGRATLVSRDSLIREVVETVIDAAFPFTDSEGQGQ